MLLDGVKGLAVNHRADVGGQIGRMAQHQLLRRTLNHRDDVVGNAFVHTQQPQRRAALASRAKSALHHRVRHLLGQRGAVDQHGIDAAGLGNQRRDGTVFGGQRAVDGAGHGCRAGEHHPGHAGCGHQRCTHRVPRAIEQLQRALGHAGFMQ